MIVHHPHEGIQPHFDPVTQTCELINKDGQDVWEIKTYTIEQMNDGSEFYASIIKSMINKKIEVIDSLKSDEKIWSSLSGSTQHNLETYSNVLKSLGDSYPKGFSIPHLPPVDLTQVNPNLLIGL